MGTVNKPIQRSLGEDRVRKKSVPVLRCPVRRHDHGANAVTLADEFVKILRLLGREFLHAEVVEYQEIGQECTS